MILNEIVSRGRFNINEAAEKEPGVLAVLSGVFAEYGKRNENGRLYEKATWDGALASADVIRDLKGKTLYGELNHPSDHMEPDPNKAAFCITELHENVSNNTIEGVAKVLDTPAGKILNTLLRFGSVLGMSSRAQGEVDENEVVIPSSYHFITFDVVTNPSNSGAHPAVVESVASKVSPMMSALLESTKEADSKGLKIIEEASTGLSPENAKAVINKVEERKSMLKEDAPKENPESETHEESPEDKAPKAETPEKEGGHDDSSESVVLSSICEKLDRIIELLTARSEPSVPEIQDSDDSEIEDPKELVAESVTGRVASKVVVKPRLSESAGESAKKVVDAKVLEESKQDDVTAERTAQMVQSGKSR